MGQVYPSTDNSSACLKSTSGRQDQNKSGTVGENYAPDLEDKEF